MDGTDRTGDNMAINALFGIEVDALEEQELQNGCTLDLSIYRHGGYIPSTRKKMCPVTPCVPARRDGR
jgi:hypothetical protein